MMNEGLQDEIMPSFRALIFVHSISKKGNNHPWAW